MLLAKNSSDDESQSESFKQADLRHSFLRTQWSTISGGTESPERKEGRNENTWKLNDFLCSLQFQFQFGFLCETIHSFTAIQPASQFGYSQNWELKETTTYLYEHDIINISLRMSKCHSNCNDVKVSICNIFIHSVTLLSSIYMWL